jgi:uncharacterized protein
MAEKSYLDSVGDYLKTLNDQGLAVRFGVVFGSWAKGNPGQWSDIDLMVVSPRFDGPRNRRGRGPALAPGGQNRQPD